MKTKTQWIDTKASRPCPACGHHGWCSVSAEGDLCLCRRGVESKRPFKQKDGTTAHLHSVADLGGEVTPTDSIAAKPKPKLSPSELKTLVKRQQTALSERRLEISAKAMGLSPASLKAYGVGWDEASHCLSFPMYDGGQRIIGVRLRRDDGRKLCIPGSSNGLFIPTDFDPEKLDDSFAHLNPYSPMCILTPEGPTDCAAAHQIGFTAIGRPSCNGGSTMLVQLLRECSQAGFPRDVVVVADADETHWLKDNTPYWPGWEGAIGLAISIRTVCKSLKVIKPIEKKKDLRELVKTVSQSAMDLGVAMIAAIDAAPPATMGWLDEKRNQIEVWRKGLKERKMKEVAK